MLPGEYDIPNSNHIPDGTVGAIALPDTPTLIANLLGKGWIESNESEGAVSYRLTDQGLVAKTTPVKI